MEERNMAKRPEQNFNRTQRREIERMNEKLDTLLEKYLHIRARLGECKELKDYWFILDRSWRNYCDSHNSKPKHQIKADPEAFHQQLRAREKMEIVIRDEQEKQRELANYLGWVRKVEMRFPKLLWRWRMINYLTKKSYVRSKWEKFQGESPRGSWL